MHVWPEKILFVIWLCCPILNYAILNYLNTTGEKFIMVDTFAHGLWSWIIFRNIKPTSDVWLAVFFGVMPDLFSWAVYMFYRFFTTGFKFGAPVLGEIPKWPFVLYGITHSIFVFGAVVLAYILSWGMFLIGYLHGEFIYSLISPHTAGIFFQLHFYGRSLTGIFQA